MMRAGVALAACAASLRTADAIRAAVVLNATAGEVPFVCPDECLECCTSGGWLSGFTGGEPEFKCLLKNWFGAAPAGRECEEPEMRKGHFMKKVSCKYLPNEGKPKQKCSDMFSCCCKKFDEEEGLPDGALSQVCADMPTDGSRHVFRDGLTYDLADSEDEPHTEENKKECVNPNNRALSWQVDDIPDSSLPPLLGVGAFGYKLDSCCLNAKTHQVVHKWMQPSLSMVAGLPRASKSWKTKVVRYKVCKSFEVIFTCSDDGGLTHNGQRLFAYKGSKGRCVGDKRATKAVYNEETDVCDMSCKCPANCGTNPDEVYD